jgi:hypothetical protein
LRRPRMRHSSDHDIAEARAITRRLSRPNLVAGRPQGSAAQNVHSALKLMNLDPGPSGFVWADDQGSKEVAFVENTLSKKLSSIGFGESKVGCSIRSISAFGAALDVFAYEGVPDEFVLTVTADGRERRCIVIWRKQERIAVAFY